MSWWRDVKDPASLVRGLGTASLEVEEGKAGAAEAYDGLLGQILRVGRAEAIRLREERERCGRIDSRLTQHGDPPTRSQERLLRFIAGWIAEKGYAPSVREMMLGVGVGSTNAVAEQVARLARKGHLVFVRGQARSLRVTVEGHTALAPKKEIHGSGEEPGPRDVGQGVGGADQGRGDAQELRGRLCELPAAP